MALDNIESDKKQDELASDNKPYVESDEEQVKPTEDTKPCPICGETVKFYAKKCIHCDHYLKSGLRSFICRRGIQDKTLWDLARLLIIPLILLIISFGISNRQDDRQRKVESERLQESTLQAIGDKLRI